MVERSPPEASLASVRRDLEEIDRAIVLLVAARIDAACKAIRCRSEIDRRVTNPAQEARVIARAQAWGEPLGLSPELTRTLFRAIMESGKEHYLSMARPSSAGASRGAARSRSRSSGRPDSPALPRAPTSTPS